MFVRKVANKSGNIAVQVVRKANRQNRIIKHIGTARSAVEVNQLLKLAHRFIDQRRIESGVISLFDNRFEKPRLHQLLSQLTFHGSIDKLTYLFLTYFYRQIGFGLIKDSCFQDLVIARIVHPSSKRNSRKTLKTRFGKAYPLNKIYQTLKVAFIQNYRDKIEETIRQFVLKQITDTISVVFFDVTTLYYEAFDEDDFRKCGFSKDRKSNQPQVMMALTITKHGIPLSLRSFSGNKFEGHTILPCILELIQKFNLNDFVVVADAAMMSKDNLKLLDDHGVKYIVGARLGSTKVKTLEKILIKITKTDGNTIRIDLNNNRFMIVSYSAKRAAKDKHDREKQLKRAEQSLADGSPAKRYKYLTAVAKGKYQINKELIAKALKLEGLKGYITNAASLTNDAVIQKYSELWQVEKAFRMSKSDLKARPIFHTLKESIESHLLIVFTALIISRYIELVSQKSIAEVLDILNEVKEIPVEDKLTG